MASTTSQAGQSWHHALKLRKHLLKQLEKLQAESASGIDIAQFEAVDGLLEQFRLACVHTIFIDFEYAVAENTEEALWGLHISINSEYRRTLGRLKHSSHPVERRKAEKMYNNFLRIAQKFYKGYIQRLSARYDVQELRIVATGIDLEHMKAGDIISPVPGDLSRMVLESCHSTLIHLGDLARYRSQAKHRSPGFETALTYYGLARHLVPHSGFAFHQMGIVNLDQGNHLDVVYHFYRAWTVELPHPNAKSNLESEFKSLRLPNAAKGGRNHASASGDAFSTWFVKLHALFYVGEKFSQQKELEEEVMHRLEMACRDAASGDTLLKMALVNISAHDIASRALDDSKTETDSLFWQFTLRFNALFALTFCRALHSELEDAVSSQSEGSSDSAAVEITSTVGSLLPTLRVYCVWLAAHREELFGAAHAFGAIVPTMMQNIVKVFTLLCTVTYHRENLATCPYLLPEDLEVRGNRPLTGDQVPKACRVYCDENGNMKPYLHDEQRRLDAVKEHLARVLDVLRCAYFLAEDISTPVTYKVVESWLVFEYRPDAAHGTSTDDSQAAAVPAAAAPVNPSPVEQVQKPVEGLDVRQIQDHAQVQREPKQHNEPTAERQAETSSQMARQLSADEEHAEQTVIAMLTPFLKPPTPQPPNHFPYREDSSSGLESTPANGLFGPKRAYPSPSTSGPSGPIAPFPWAWDNTPKPDSVQDAATSAGKEAFIRASRNNSPKESMTRRASLWDDPFGTPGRDAARAYPSSYVDLSKAGNGNSTLGPGADQVHRDQLLQSLTANSAPRTSASDQRVDEWAASWRKAMSPWASRTLDANPASTGESGFSHPSSLFMGTPADGVGLGVSGHMALGRNDLQSPTHGANGPSSMRRAQAGNSVSNFELFRAAMGSIRKVNT
ncbi:hypothetical protein CDD83_8631 [Cordyceps sp. RAO-2017]|nr:hypothetical protein CDD83_8631 [Cordyceps sp. RAO-2017]